MKDKKPTVISIDALNTLGKVRHPLTMSTLNTGLEGKHLDTTVAAD